MANNLGVVIFTDEIVLFKRILVQVEELVAVDLGIVNQFPALVSHHTLFVTKVAVYLRVDGILFLAYDRFQATALDAFGNGQTDEVAGRGKEVAQVAEGRVALALGDTRPGHDQGHPDGVFVHVLLPHQAMASNGQTMVAGEDNQSVLGLLRLIENGQYATDLLVHVRDDGIVDGEVFPDHIGVARPRQHLLVASLEIAMVEGMARQKVLRQGNFGRIVFVLVSRRHQERVVRRREVDLQKERLVRLATDEAYGGIGELRTDIRCQAHATLGKFLTILGLEKPVSIASDLQPLPVDLRLVPLASATGEEAQAFAESVVGWFVVVVPFPDVP